MGSLGEDADKTQPLGKTSGDKPLEADATPPDSAPPVETAPPAESAPGAIAAPPPEEPLTDIQRRAQLAETDLTQPQPDDHQEFLAKISEEIKGLEGEEGLIELERIRDQINMEAEDRRTNRDKFNMRTKQCAEKRDRLNSEVAKRVAEAGEHREKRNKLNEEVKAAKVMRDQLNSKANELAEVAAKLKHERHREVAVPVPRLREEKRALEYRLQTVPMTMPKEKEIVAELKRIEREIRASEATMESDKEVHEAVQAARLSKQEAEEQHKKLSELARAAQAEHDAMMKLYEEADAIRKEADDAQQEFLASKREADTEHFGHIDLIRKVKDYDKIVSGIRRRRREMRRAETERRQEKKTDTMMEKFKKGEKLSTEDLLALQLRGD